MNYLNLHNSQSVALEDLPLSSMSSFEADMSQALQAGCRILALCAVELESPALIAALGDPQNGCLRLSATRIGPQYPALTPQICQAARFEREIFEQSGHIPLGHPDLIPLRNPAAPADFGKPLGAEIHEVGVGPVHAGVIEPGHFRFHCHGEKILNLQIALGYQHRGVERALKGGPDKRTLSYMETLAGDTSIGHTSAYVQTIESLSGTAVPPRAQVIRAIALELERLANHTGDLGAMAGDVGYQPTAAYCGRLRGEYLNLTALICGNRFGRRLNRPGGTAYDLDANLAAELRTRLAKTFAQTQEAVRLLWETPSVLARFEETGILSRATARELGLVGPAARASGLEIDARFDFPAGAYTFAQLPVSTWTSGDVYARARVRELEIRRSVDFIYQLLAILPPGAPYQAPAKIRSGHLCVTVVEGWRGEICHMAITGADGSLAHYKIVDPSFHNWPGLAAAVRGEAIMDFPLCNKSFNLSYCGHDL